MNDLETLPEVRVRTEHRKVWCVEFVGGPMKDESVFLNDLSAKEYISKRMAVFLDNPADAHEAYAYANQCMENVSGE